MSTLFAFVFVAALAGVLKPYVKGANRKHFGAAAAVAFILFAITAPPPQQSESATSENSSKATSANDSGSAEGRANSVASAAAAEPQSNWQYSEDRDEMRDSTSRYASVRSENEVDLQFPYGTVNGTIWIRQRSEDGLTVAFGVSEGQVLCNAFTDSSISIRFDDGPVQRFRCAGSSDGSTETAFITNGGRALAGLRRARRTIVEAEFFQQGRKQFTFETAGLEWN